MEGWMRVCSTGGMSPTGKNNSTWRKNLSQRNFVHDKSHTDRPGIEPDPLTATGQPVEWYWLGKTKAGGGRPTPVPHCLPQKPHELAWDWTQAFTVRHQQLTAYILYKVFIVSSNTSIITIGSTYKATCFGQVGPSSGLTIRTGSFTSSTFWDPKLFTKVVWRYNAVCCYLR
jgi:hypothetical protein